MALAAGLAGSAPAQSLPSLGGAPSLDLPQLPLGVLGGAGDQALSDARGLLDPDRLTGLRRLRLDGLVRANPRALDVDDAGAPVVRGEVLAISPTPAALEIARQAGFTVARRTSLAALGVELVVMSAPEGTSARQALKLLRGRDPAGRYDLDHIYSPAGAVDQMATRNAAPAPGGGDAKVRVGLLDTGVARDHPAFAESRIEQRGFAPGGVKVADHGAAVASLMVGHTARFSGAAPGATLFAADVYGSGPAGGSADAIARALSWMAENHIGVVNVSLVGPANLTLEVAVEALLARGALIVAPVGNDGPAAPPLYPASYPGVIAVTAVDERGRTLFEAGRASHVDFAAPGAGVQAARAGGGFARVRGTSFAAPIVAGRLALWLREPDPARAAAAKARLAAEARAGRGAIRPPPAMGR